MEEKNQRKNWPVIVAIGVLIVVIVIAIVALCFHFFGNQNPDDPAQDDLDITVLPVVNKIEYAYEIPLYACDGNVQYLVADSSDYCNEVAFSLPAKTDISFVLAISNYGKMILYYDGEDTVLYTRRSGELKVINFPFIPYDNGYTYFVYSYDNWTDPVGIGFHAYDSYISGSETPPGGFYSFAAERVLYENQYYVFRELSGGYMVGYLDENTDYSVVLNTSKEEINSLNRNQCGTYSDYFHDYIVYYHCAAGGDTAADFDFSVADFYTLDLKPIVKNVSSEDFLVTTTFNTLCIFNHDNPTQVTMYNKAGEQTQQYPLEGEIIDIFDEYYLVKEDGMLYLKNYATGRIKAIAEFPETAIYVSLESGYYDHYSDSDGAELPSGFYFTIGDETSSDNNGTQYYFNPDNGETWSREITCMGAYGKPVLYFYPTATTTVSVSFAHPENLTTTYPKFTGQWLVTATPNGDLYDAAGKYYYGLYWEESANHQVDFSTGFYVEKANAIDFLEEKLTQIGLNDRERNEFIMYWLPILEQNGKSLVYFELTTERNSYNQLNISPAPDSLLRVAIHVKKVNQKVNIREEKLESFTRSGFTAVEWGGINY